MKQIFIFIGLFTFCWGFAQVPYSKYVKLKTIDNADILKIDSTKLFSKIVNDNECCFDSYRIFIDTIVNENGSFSIAGYTSVDAIIHGNVQIAIYKKKRKRYYLKQILCTSDSNGFFNTTITLDTTLYISPYVNSQAEIYKLSEIKKMISK